MNEAWNKAIRELQKIAGERPSLLKCEQWASGMAHKNMSTQYSAYIEGIGHTDWESTPGKAIRDMKDKLKIK